MHLVQPVESAVGLMQLTHIGGLAKKAKYHCNGALLCEKAITLGTVAVVALEQHCIQKALVNAFKSRQCNQA